MSDIYVLKSLSNAEEYIKINGNISNIKIPVMKSEIHHLDKKTIEFSISDEGGLSIPDLIYYEGIFLFSNKLKQALDERNIDYVFWKKADVNSEQFGIHESFWIIVPPRIDCIDIDKSDLNFEWDFEGGLLPMLEANKIVIQNKLVGRFEVFKLLGIMDNNIYITSKLREVIISKGFEGIEFLKL